ncbi:MAG TPA: NADH-quinone oxidoreductase subunit J [Terriglobia bacterium]|nr:NADH-quinone oxidoreductase subunit J [Terriglobia bacterium]
MSWLSLPQITFLALSAMALVSGVLVITRRNAIHSVICLIVTLFSVAGIFLLTHAEFLFAVQIILYVGGIMVLFLFVIMLVNLDVAAKQAQFSSHWLVAVLTAGALTAELAYGIYLGRQEFKPSTPPAFILPINNTRGIAVGLFQTYTLPLEIASLLLLVAMVGAVVMAKRKFE